MAPEQFHVPRLFDYLATFLFAVSGSLVAGRRGYDITGIVIVAFVSSTGGGLIRDGIFLQAGPPLLLRSPAYLAFVGAAVALVWVFGRALQRARAVDTLVRAADAFGLGAYAVVGMELAAAQGLSPYSMAVVGVANAVGGGLIRDVLMREEPKLFLPGTLNTLAVVPACITYLVLTGVLGLGASVAGWLATATSFVLRVAAVRFDLKTRPPRSLSGH